VDRANKSLGKNVLNILRPEVQKKLATHEWRGNIRELEGTITSAVATTRSNVLLSGDIEFH